jgi:hypothetical protein
MTKPLKVYQLVEGPISTYDIPMWNEPHGWLVVALVEQENGALEEEEIVLDTFDEAYDIVKWFKGQIIPYEVIGYA